MNWNFKQPITSIKHLSSLFLMNRFSLLKQALFIALFLSLTGLAQSQITTLQNWTNLYHGTSNTTTNAITVPAGTKRVLVIAISSNLTSAGSKTIQTLTFGGRALTLINGDMGSSLLQHTALYYLKESEIGLAVGSNVIFTMATGNIRINDIWWSVYDNVDQNSPITDSKNYNSGGSTVTSFQFSTALNINTNNQALFVATAFRTGITTLRNYTLPTNWTSSNAQTNTSTDASNNIVTKRAIPATNITDVCSTTLSGNNSLVSMTAVSLNVFSCTPATANAGTALSAICKGGTSAALGGAVGGSATGGTWGDGGAGGTFTPNATTLNATYTPAASFSGTVTLTLTSSGGTCNVATTSKSLEVTPTPTATINYSSTSFCNTITAAQPATLTGTTGGTYSSSPAGLSLNATTGAITPSTSSLGTYTITYTIAAAGGCAALSTLKTITITGDAYSINYPSLSYCKSVGGTINITRNAPVGGTYTSSPAGLSIDPSTGTVSITNSSAGSYTIIYTFAGGVCSNAVTATLNIFDSPVVTCPSNMTVCTSAPQFLLTGASPLGGTFSGVGVSGSNFNPATAGGGNHTITYNYTSGSGCSNSCSFVISVLSSGPIMSATAATNYVYTGNTATINLSSNISGTQYTWTVSSNNPQISGYSNQTVPTTGPINQTLYNPSPTIGNLTYIITPSISGCSGSPVSVVISMPSSTFCESPGTFQAGSCIIDMGVTPQTYANGLKPYGLLYQLLNVYNVPVYWAINPDKTFVTTSPKVDQTDFTVDGINYKGGAFIVPASYLSVVQSTINSWAAQGVVVRYASTNFNPPTYELLTRIPKVVLDITTGALIETGFYTRAGIPITAYTKGGIPNAITNCDDIYVLPHAEPQNWSQAQKDSLRTFINQRGWFFSSCYAVSFIENMAGMNFLSNNGLLAYNAHGNPTIPYNYSIGAGLENTNIAGDPFMQFMGTLDGAINSDQAYEKVYVPKPEGWRSSTKIAIYKSNYTNSGITYPNNAAILAYGKAYGDQTKGMVMYLSGHDFESGPTEADNVAKSRVYANFLLRAGIGTRPAIIPVSIPTSVNSGETIALSVSVPPSTSTIDSYQWTSDLNGIFSAPQSITTNFTAPTVDFPTPCTVQFKVTDACGRSGLFCTTIMVNPTITNNYISNAQTVCIGSVPQVLTGTLPVPPSASAITYLWLMSTTNSSAGFAAAPGTNNLQNYTPAAVSQTTWFRRQVSANGITVISSSIEITVTAGPEISLQPSSAIQGVCQGGALTALTVATPVAGVTYQWYSNTSASYTGGTALSGAGATTASLSPSSALQGTLYYYCKITSAAGCISTSTISGAISVISNLQITSPPSTLTQNVCLGAPMTILSVVANGSGLSYQWYYTTTSTNATGTLITGATSSTYTPTLAGPYYYHCRVFSPSCNQLVKSAPSGQITIKPLPTPAITNNTGSYALTCEIDSINMTASGGTSYSWSNGLGSNANAVVTAVGNYTVTVTGANGCSAPSTFSITSNISGSKWTGAADNYWDNPNNWCGAVPTDTSNVVITAGTLNEPIISNSIAKVKNLSIDNGVTVYIDDETLEVYGSLNTNGNLNAVNGSINMKGTVPQTLSGSMFAAHRIQNLKLSNNNGVTLAGTNDTLKITGALEFGESNVTLITNGNLTITSNINGTARVSDMTKNGQYFGNKISGNVTVERYVPNHAKAWQLLSAPTIGQTVNAAWQEGNTTLSNAVNPGYGTIITSNLPGAVTSLGFDVYTPAGGTMKTYNPSDSTWVSIPSTFSPIANTKGYMTLLRGDRSVTAYNQAATATTLRTTGELYQSEINVPSTIDVLADRYESVGNPYASAIDPGQLIRTGGVQDVYYVWDPRLTTSPTSVWGLGAFQTIVKTGSTYTVIPGGGSYSNGNTNIESGQAFLVRSMGAVGTLSFSETCKTNGSNVVTREQSTIPQLKVQLSVLNAGSPILLDGALTMISNDYNNGIDGNDALKMTFGTTENIAIYRSGTRLVAEQRVPTLRTDTLFYNITGLKRQSYQFDFTATNFAALGYTAKLMDKYLGTATPLDLRGENSTSFTVNGDPLSYSPDRFYIIFSKLRAAVNPRTVSLIPSQNKTTSLGSENGTAQISIYPNPVQNQHANIVFENCDAGNYIIKIYTSAGQLLQSNRCNISTSMQQVRLNLKKQINGGAYKIKVESAKGVLFRETMIVE